MKNNILNIILSILLSITTFLVILVFTIFNKNYIKHILNKYNYYEDIRNNIISDLNEYDSSLEYDLDINDIVKDTNNYIDNNYKDKIYFNKINITNLDIIPSNISDIYNNNIKFIKINNYSFIKDIFLLITLIMVIIVGILFNKTKNKHNIKYILILSNILNIFIYGILYILFNTDSLIIERIVITSLHYYLGLSIIIIEYVCFKKLLVKD